MPALGGAFDPAFLGAFAIGGPMLGSGGSDFVSIARAVFERRKSNIDAKTELREVIGGMTPEQIMLLSGPIPPPLQRALIEQAAEDG